VRLGRVSLGGSVALATETDAGLRPLGDAWTDMVSLIEAGTGALAPVAGPLDGDPIDADRLLAPIRPGKVVAIGLNYRDHVRETNLEMPTSPLIFAKFPSSVIGPSESIVIEDDLTERVDWEVEMAVVIGRRARGVSRAAALDHVFGYTVANDVSARDLQFNDGQWVRGKSLDTFCPLGPVIVTADEIPDPQSLALTTRVNGELVQQSNTSEMIFDVASIIGHCSHSFTLEAGDVVLTGTPWGCGEFMEPRRSLVPGDVVECSVAGIGSLCNRVVAGSSNGMAIPAPRQDDVNLDGGSDRF
jgi:5-carboxymethyl-2-hydroxymuconate isomerase